MPEPIDQNARRDFIQTNFKDISFDGKEQRLDCPRCGAKKGFTLNTGDAGFPWKCWSACGAGNIFTTQDLGLPKFTDKGFNTGRKTGLPELEFLRRQYQQATGKSSRLSHIVINHFGLKPFTYKNKDNMRTHKALSTFGGDDRPMKRLVAKKWIGIDQQLRSSQLWYGQDKISSADKKIYVTAGEWDLFAFWEHTRLDSIAWPNGEGPKNWKAEELSVFGQNKQIIILYDNDKVGREGAVSLAASILRFIKCEYVKIVDLSCLGLLGGQDLDDFFDKAGTKERLFQEVADTKPFNVSQALHELEDNPLPKPDGKFFFNGETIGAIWNAAQFTQARREDEFGKVAFALTGRNAGGLYKEALLQISHEVNSLRYLASIDLVRATFKERHIVRRKSHLGDQGFNLLHYSGGVYVLCDENYFEVIADDILRKVFPADKIRSRKQDREAILEEMRILTNYQAEQVFDTDKNFINFENGLYSIKEKKLQAHRPDHFSTFQVKVSFEESSAPNFLQALERWFDVENAREFIKGVYYFLTGNRAEEVALCLRGPGNDGKSKSIEIFKALAGPGSTSAISLSELTGHTLASLDGSFLNVVEDASDQKFDSGAFKKVVSGGLTQINQKNRPVYSIEPKALFVIASNYPIRNSDTTRGFLRRWKLIEYKEIKAKDQVRDFFNRKLKDELAGICFYCITEGAKLWEQDRGFRATEQEETEKVDMRANSSPDAYFLHMMDLYNESGEDFSSRRGLVDFFKCDVDKEKGIGSDYIDIISPEHYKNYVEFCTDNGVSPAGHKKYNQNAQRFFNETLNGMVDEGFVIIRNTRRRVVVDLIPVRRRVLNVELPNGLELLDFLLEKEMPF